MKPINLLLLLIWAFSTKCFGKVERDFAATAIDSIPKIGPDQSLGFGKKKHTVWLNLSQLGVMENQISYERQFFDNWGLEGIVGFKFPKHLNEPYDLSMRSIGPKYYYDYIALFPFSAGLLASISVKHYLTKDKDLYAAGSYFYRYWFFNDQTINSSEMSSQAPNNFSSEQSLRMHVNGFKLLLGCVIGRFHFHGNRDMVVDFYSGFGYRVKRVMVDSPPFTFPQNTQSISLQAGLKVGLNF